MKYELNGVYYDVVITKKNNKNLYVRVKDDKKIYVSCNYFTTKSMIKKILDNNISFLNKAFSKVSRNTLENKLFYLGKSYDIIIDENVENVKIIDDKIIAKNNLVLNKWYKDETIRIFDLRYVYVFNNFKENITSPILKIRNMKTRWGVYNKKNHTITLNSKLIEFDIEKIDYVIIHELSHIIHFNHSKEFWNLVSKYSKDYKRIRKEMKES